MEDEDRMKRRWMGMRMRMRWNGIEE